MGLWDLLVVTLLFTNHLFHAWLKGCEQVYKRRILRVVKMQYWTTLQIEVLTAKGWDKEGRNLNI